MQFVGMQDVTLTRQAVPLLAAISEGLHARKGDADRIGVVAVRAEGVALEIRLQSLDPGGPGPDPDAVRATGRVIA